MTVIASQCAHWRGNLLSFPGTFHGTFPKIHEIATPACGLVRNDTLIDKLEFETEKPAEFGGLCVRYGGYSSVMTGRIMGLRLVVL